MANPTFHGWENFYYLIGSAGAGLIGLLFVVVTLTSGYERSQALRGQSLYMTPTALHFALVLSISAVALAPGLPTSGTATIIGLIAFGGLARAGWSCLGIGRPRPGSEAPHWSDFWMYGVTPAAIYVGLCAVCIALGLHARWAAYVMATLLLSLLLVGIRNAWDLITWIAPKRAGEAGPAPPS